MCFAIICAFLTKAAPSETKNSFPYSSIEKGYAEEKNNISPMRTFFNNGERKGIRHNLEGYYIPGFEKPSIQKYETNNPPLPTSNPLLTQAIITVTTGTEVIAVTTTVYTIKTQIEANSPKDGLTYTNKYTETFTKGANDTYTLTQIKTQQIVPTIISVNSPIESSFLTTTYTLGKIVTITHITTESLTSLLVSTKTTPIGGSTFSKSPQYNPTGSSTCMTETSFDSEVETSIFTMLSQTYTWTVDDSTATYKITSPKGYTKTKIPNGVKVTVTGCNAPTTTELILLTDVTVTQIDTYVLTTFPTISPIPTYSTPNLEREIITLTFTHSDIDTDVISTSATKCKTNGIMATWTIAPSYTSTFVGNTYTMTNTGIIQRVVTEVGNGNTCYDVSISKIKVATDTFTTTKVNTMAYTETVISTSSIYYSVSSTKYEISKSISETTLVPGQSYVTLTMTDILVIVGSKEDMTFLQTYGASYYLTTTGYTTTAWTYSDVHTSSIDYSPIPKNISINTITLTLLRSESHGTQITQSSICTNYLGNSNTSISSTVIYTYAEYMTLVEVKNTGNIDITLTELGETKNTKIISVNALHTHVEKETMTVIKLDSTTTLHPNSTCTNSIVKTMYYTATYIKDPTSVVSFEDQCNFKLFTYSSTYSFFPTIKESQYASIVTVSTNVKELTMIEVPTTFSVFTYGYTILDSTATYILADFVNFTMTNEFIYPGETKYLTTQVDKYRTATGSNFVSKTIVEYIPVRSPFAVPNIEELNPYYTTTNITVTTASGFGTTMTTIYQKNITYTEATVTNVFTSTTVLTETFVRSGDSLSVAYSTVDVLVPTQISVESGLITTTLTYHKTVTNYYTVTHTIQETVTEANTFFSGRHDPAVKTNVSSYSQFDTKVCYHSFEASSPTTAYVFTDIFSTWLWTSVNKKVSYTITMLKDYTITNVSPNDGKKAYIATYSCTGTTTIYSNTYTETNVSDYTTFVGADFPKASPIPTPDGSGDVDTPIATEMLTLTYTKNYNTYVAQLSSTMCSTNTNAVTLTYLQTFKQTFVQKDENDYVQTYTYTQTVGYTIAKLLLNETMCNTHILTKTATQTEVFSVVGVADARTNNMFKVSIVSTSIPYAAPLASSLTETYTKSMVSLDAKGSSKVYTMVHADVQTFVKIGELLTHVETYTETVNMTDLKGPTVAEVLTPTTTGQYTVYTAKSSFTKAYSTVYTQKSGQEITAQFAINPCISFGTKTIVAPLETFIETFSEYAVLASFVNGGKDTTNLVNVGTFMETVVAAAMFFETTTALSSSTVVRLNKPINVKPGEKIDNSVTTAFTLTQMYVSGVTEHTQFVDICGTYSIVEKETKIPIPVLTNTETLILVQTKTSVTAPTDVEYITYASELEYREGLTMYRYDPTNKVALEYKEIPTRTFSLFQSYTYTSAFFDKAMSGLIYALAPQRTNTVVEVLQKTFTLILDTPEIYDDDSNNNLVYIIVGVVVGVIVISAIVAAVLIVKKRSLYGSNHITIYHPSIQKNQLTTQLYAIIDGSDCQI